eukprot:SAG31_NODE_9902_length_1214_cov_1.065471_2_plen_79_part_01
MYSCTLPGSVIISKLQLTDEDSLVKLEPVLETSLRQPGDMVNASAAEMVACPGDNISYCILQTAVVCAIDDSSLQQKPA